MAEQGSSWYRSSAYLIPALDAIYSQRRAGRALFKISRNLDEDRIGAVACRQAPDGLREAG